MLAFSTVMASDPIRSDELVHVSDTDPGIRRLPWGRGFRYVRSDGEPVTADDRQRIQMLAIPPAWQDVWICADKRGHLQATGRDARGRKQYRYHPVWMAMQGETKFSSLAQFARSLSPLRQAVETDLRRRTLCREKVRATVIWLMDRRLVRIGNSTYARDNKSFGVTTLRSRHLKIDGGQPRLVFTGKSGKMWSLSIDDKRISRIIRSIHELPGQHLFQYTDEDGHRRPISSQDVNEYLREAMKADFTSKHFRTWAATAMALNALSTISPPSSDAAQRRILNAEIDKVAHALGNTRAVCRGSYIHPAIFEHWAAGSLTDEVQAASTLRVIAPKLTQAERRTLKWLTYLDARI